MYQGRPTNTKYTKTPIENMKAVLEFVESGLQ